jgi:photosystem II stability/assembly factor-like uncharacterized protein
MYLKKVSSAVALTATVFSCGLVWAAQKQSYQAPLVKESMLLDIEVNDITVIVGERGHVLIKKDGDLVQSNVPTTATLTAVSNIGQKIWAVGHDATIIASDDGGESWSIQLQMPELDRPFLDVAFFNENHGVALGAYGLFYRTRDGGETWIKELHASVLPQADIDYLDTIKDDQAFYEEELSFILPHFNRVSFQANTLFLAGEAGLIAYSDNLGESWKRQEVDYFGSFFDVASFETDNQSVTLAAGLRGNLFATKGMGFDWVPVETCVTTSLNSFVVNEGKTFVAGNNGVLFEINVSQVFTDKRLPPNSDECAQSAALSMIDSGVDDAILNADYQNGQLFAVTASGIKFLKAE